MQHNFETIKRKVQMGGNVLPAEVVLCLRELLVKFDVMQEKLDGLETTTKSGQGTGSVPKGKVSKSKVRSKSDN